jgi:Bacterial Ig-like domain
LKTRLIIFVLFSALLYSCAQIVPLSGGEKDIQFPKEVKSNPLNGSVNFIDQKIIIEFDEFIRLQNLSSQLIISPFMDETPEIMARGKKLVIKLKSELSPNTTYSINFGDAIIDITEGNAIPNFKYVFSTGTYLDSLSYSGKMADAFMLTPEEKVYVMLYDQFTDSIPLKETPRYLAITNKEGEFSITNIAKGNYKFFALTDINSNYMYDLPNEEIAFLNEPIQIDSSSTNHTIFLFNEDNDVQFLKKAENKTFGKIDFELNVPTQDLKIIPNVPIEIFEDKNETGDSLTIWMKKFNSMGELEFLIKDGDEIIDTANIDLIHSEKFTDSILTFSSNVSSSFDLNKNIHLIGERPISNYSIDNIQLLEDSIPIEFEFTVTDKISRKFSLNYKFKEDTKYTLFIPPNTFTDIYDLPNDTMLYQFTTKKESDYGNLFLSYNPNFLTNSIIQLYKGDQLINEAVYSGETKVTYNYLTPGDYQIKLIVDENSNNKWDTGNYLEHQQPEQVIDYEKAIKIRANWDNEAIWNVKL